MVNTFYDHPDINIRETDEWVSLQDNRSYYWDGFDWIENTHTSYHYTDDGWKSFNYKIDHDRTIWEATGWIVQGGSLSSNYPYQYSEGGSSFLRDSSLPFVGYRRLYQGDGFLRYRTPDLNGRFYFRFYLQTTPTVFGYNRRLFTFSKADGSEVFSLGLYISGSDSEGDEENRLLLMKDSLPVAEGLSWVGTSPGALRPGAWEDTTNWRRVEIMIDPGYGMVVNVYPYDSEVPSDSNTWQVTDFDFSGIHTLELSESAYTFPELRSYTRVGYMGISRSAWPATLPDNRYARVWGNTGNSTSNSTSIPMSSPNISSGYYSLVVVSYTDQHTNTLTPNITAPPGYERLGFSYVGAVGDNTRSFVFVYGRHFPLGDTSSKSFSVGGGRTGWWTMNERTYLFVNQTNPVSVTWDHVPNTLRGGGNENVLFVPPDVGPTERGDVTITVALTKSDASTSSTIGDPAPHKPLTGSLFPPGAIANRSLLASRRVHLNVCDVSEETSPHKGAPCITARRIITSSCAVGRITLRSAANSPVGTFEPYPVPINIVDL